MRLRSSILPCCLAASFTIVAGSARAKDINATLTARLQLNQSQFKAGDRFIGRIVIKNVSSKEIQLIKFGALYTAYWFRFEGNGTSVKPERQIEKLFNDYVSPEDIITLKPGDSVSFRREGVFQKSKRRLGQVVLDFGDSAFDLECGRDYFVRGKFVAREDRFRRFRVISGEIRSPPIPIRIDNT